MKLKSVTVTLVALILMAIFSVTAQAQVTAPGIVTPAANDCARTIVLSNGGSYQLTLDPTGAQCVRGVSVTMVATSASAATATATLPAVTAKYHYITRIRIARTCTSAITGTAALTVSTTNLPAPAGSAGYIYSIGNACAVGTQNTDVDETFDLHPLKSLATGTATTIVLPSIGTAGIGSINVWYYTAP